jgi:dipeptidase D
VVTTSEDSIDILTSQRSLRESEKFAITDKVNSLFELAGADVVNSDGYPAWQPDINSKLVKTSVEIYKNMYGAEPIIETIHAGLECGLVGEKYPGMDMISFGPTLKEVHTPNEKIQVSTVAKCWDLLKAIIENLPEKK